MKTLDKAMFNDPQIDGYEDQADFYAEIQAEAVSGLPTPEEVTQLTIDEANEEPVTNQRDIDIMMVGYNQALLDVGQAALPEGWTAADLQEVINKQREKLGI